MRNQTDIEQQYSILMTYRQRLSDHLQQCAIHGEANAPSVILHGIREARDHIRRIKDILRIWGVEIDDHPDDNPSDPVSFLKRSTQTTRIESQFIGEGLIALGDLMQIPEVRDTTSRLQANLQIASQQITLLLEYKSIHDQFHLLESCCNPIYPSIYRNGQLLSSEEINWEVLEYLVIELQNCIDNLLDFAVEVSFAADTLAWRLKLKRTYNELEEGIKNNSAEQLKKAIKRVRDVLVREFSRINNSLVTAAKTAQLSVLAQALVSVRDRLLGFNLDTLSLQRFKIFANGVDILVSISARLSVSIDDHNQWQVIDDELRRVEVLLDKEASELEDNWPDLKLMIHLLCTQSTDDWAIKLNLVCIELEDALSSRNPVRIRRVFRDLRTRERVRFYQIDQALLRLCGDLQKVGEEPLSAVLKMLE